MQKGNYILSKLKASRLQVKIHKYKFLSKNKLRKQVFIFNIIINVEKIGYLLLILISYSLLSHFAS